MNLQLIIRLLVIMLFLPFVLQAQKGKITKRDGREVEGIIEYSNWMGANPAKINFSLDGEKFETLGLDDLKSFSVTRRDGETESYARKIIKFQDKYADIDVPTNDEQFEMSNKPPVVDTVFLLVLQKGKIDLYRQEYEGGQIHYFVEKEGEELIELIETTYVYETEYKLRGQKKYRAQVGKLIKDCAINHNSLIKQLEYTQGSINKLVRVYNKCQDDLEYEHKNEKPLVDFIFFSGLAINRGTLRGDNTPSRLVNKENNAQTIQPDYIFGVAINVTIPRKREKIYFQSELVFRPVRLYFKNETQLPDLNNLYGWYAEGSLELLYLRIDGLVGYKYLNKNAWNAAVHGGVVVGTVLKHNSSYFSQTTTNGAVSPATEGYLLNNEVAKLDIGFILGLPFVHKTGFSLEARVEMSSGASKTPKVTANFTGIQILAGYRF